MCEKFVSPDAAARIVVVVVDVILIKSKQVMELSMCTYI
jgi:hypothetical protein